jgi:hypothetical protein
VFFSCIYKAFMQRFTKSLSTHFIRDTFCPIDHLTMTGGQMLPRPREEGRKNVFFSLFFPLFYSLRTREFIMIVFYS